MEWTWSFPAPPCLATSLPEVLPIHAYQILQLKAAAQLYKDSEDLYSSHPAYRDSTEQFQ